MDLTDRLIIQPELLFSMQGYKYDHPSLEEDPLFQNIYLNIPIMLRYRVMEDWYLEAGPQFGILLNSRNKLADVDSKDLFKSFDLGINIGAGYRLPIGLVVELRYNFGLFNFNEAKDEGTLKNRVFSLGAAYTIQDDLE